MSFSWQVTPEQAFIPLYAQYAEELEREIVALAERMTDEITEWMKQNAPWQDRTGETRSSLFSVVQHEARQLVSILISHGSLITHSEALELGFGGRFAIIAPSVDWFGPRVFHEVQAIMRRVRVP